MSPTALLQIIESQRQLLNALESMVKTDGAVKTVLAEPKIVHANQDEMSPEEEVYWSEHVEAERQALLRQVRASGEVIDNFAPPEEQSEEEPVLLHHVVDTMRLKDTTRGLDQNELMSALNL